MKKKRNSSGFHSSLGHPQDNNKLRELNLELGPLTFVLYGLLLTLVAASSVNGAPITSVDIDSDNYRRSGSSSSSYSSSLHYNPSQSFKQRISSSSSIVFPEERNDLIPKSKKDFMNYKGDNGNRIEFPYEPPGLRTYSYSHLPPPSRRNHGLLPLGERLFEGNVDANAGRLESGPTHKRYLLKEFNYPAMIVQTTTTTRKPIYKDSGEISGDVDTNKVDPEVPKLIGEFTEYLRGKKYFERKKEDGNEADKSPDSAPANFSFNAAGIKDRNCTNGTVRIGDECKIALE